MNAAIAADMRSAFDRVFESKWYVLGAEVDQFEQSYAAFNGTAHCIGVSNGLDALFLSLKALGIGEGDEVVVPSNTYIASLLAVTYTGATPVLVEPRTDTCNIDPDKIAAAVTPRTRAIMPVHLYGQCCEMDAIMDLAAKYGLFVVEDNAQAQGAAFNNKLAGSFGKVNATSFYPGKNLGALGDAGAITTDDSEIREKIRMLRNYGSQRKYFNEVTGYNMRLDELQAAFLSVKLKLLEKWTEERKQIADWYYQALNDVEGITLPVVAEGATHVYHLFVVRTADREGLQKHLAAEGIGTLIHYPIPPHLQMAYKSLGFKSGDFPIAERIAATCLSLPLWPGMQHAEVKLVSESIKCFLKSGNS